MLTGNATAGVNLGTSTANELAQTATSTGSALASIYGNQSAGVGNAINSGMNNYMVMNALSPQTTGYNVTGTPPRPSQQYGKPPRRPAAAALVGTDRWRPSGRSHRRTPMCCSIPPGPSAPRRTSSATS
jgi:hypothetical protein